MGFYDEFSFLKNESFEVELFFDSVFLCFFGFHWHVVFSVGVIGLFFFWHDLWG